MGQAESAAAPGAAEDLALSSSSPPDVGFHVVQVTPNSPGAQAGLEGYFDIIVQCNNRVLDEDDKWFEQELGNSLGKSINLIVYSARTEQFRKVTLIPNNTWGGVGVVGISIRFSAFDRATEHVWHVLEVHPNSPASTAGLHSETDYIVGTPEIIFSDPEEFYQLVGRKIDQSLNLYVYNSKTRLVRLVTLIPRRNWGGSGVLGCDIGYGLLHRVPREGPPTPSQAPAVTAPPPTIHAHMILPNGSPAAGSSATAPIPASASPFKPTSAPLPVHSNAPTPVVMSEVPVASNNSPTVVPAPVASSPAKPPTVFAPPPMQQTPVKPPSVASPAVSTPVSASPAVSTPPPAASTPVKPPSVFTPVVAPQMTPNTSSVPPTSATPFVPKVVPTSPSPASPSIASRVPFTPIVPSAVNPSLSTPKTFTPVIPGNPSFQAAPSSSPAPTTAPVVSTSVVTPPKPVVAPAPVPVAQASPSSAAPAGIKPLPTFTIPPMPTFNYKPLTPSTPGTPASTSTAPAPSVTSAGFPKPPTFTFTPSKTSVAPSAPSISPSTAPSTSTPAPQVQGAPASAQVSAVPDSLFGESSGQQSSSNWPF